MKRKWIRSLMTGLLVVALGVLLNGVGLEGGGGAGLTGDPPEDPVLFGGLFCSTPPEGWDPDEWCKYIRAIQTLDYIMDEVTAMAFFSFQYPSTYSQLGQSIYACVRSQDLVNPYTGQPVQEESDPTPGNLRWTYNPETKDLTVEIAVVHNGEKQFHTRSYPGSDLSIYHQQEQEKPYPKYPPDAPETVQRSWMCGWILDFLYIQSIYPNRVDSNLEDEYMGSLPPTYTELLRRFPVLKKMWNPFQSRFIQEVPMDDGWATPHPGDVSYNYWIEPDGTQAHEFYVWGEGAEDGTGDWIY